MIKPTGQNALPSIKSVGRKRFLSVSPILVTVSDTWNSEELHGKDNLAHRLKEECFVTVK